MDELIMRGNDLVFRLSVAGDRDPDHGDLGAGAINAIIAIGIFNIPVFRPRRARRGAAPLGARIYPCRPRGWQNAARISVEHILPNVMNLLIVQGDDPILAGYPCRSGPSLCRPGCATADTQLGAHAGGCANHGQHRTASWR